MIPAERLFTVVSREPPAAPRGGPAASSRPMAASSSNNLTTETRVQACCYRLRIFTNAILILAVVVFPADHFILRRTSSWRMWIGPFASSSRIPPKVVLLGINPSEAEPEYG